jgi:hypothetical protein
MDATCLSPPGTWTFPQAVDFKRKIPLLVTPTSARRDLIEKYQWVDKFSYQVINSNAFHAKILA